MWGMSQFGWYDIDCYEQSGQITLLVCHYIGDAHIMMMSS